MSLCGRDREREELFQSDRTGSRFTRRFLPAIQAAETGGRQRQGAALSDLYHDTVVKTRLKVLESQFKLCLSSKLFTSDKPKLCIYRKASSSEVAVPRMCDFGLAHTC